MFRTVSLLTAVALVLGTAFVVVPGPVLAKKPGNPPPEPDPDPAIAYVKNSGKGKNEQRELMVMNADGTNQTVVYNAGQNWIQGVDWSPDGTQLVFNMTDGEDTAIYAIDLDGSNLSLVIATLRLASAPVWSPKPVPGIGDDEYRIAWSQQVLGEQPDVYIVNIDGTDLVRLFSTPLMAERAPTWSPSGEKLVFNVRDYNSQPPGNRWGLYDFSAGSCTIKTFGDIGGSHNFTDEWAPAWSKTEEDKIAWPAAVDGGHYPDIWVFDIDGADDTYPLRVTNTSNMRETGPSWSPDDSRIAILNNYYSSNKAKSKVETIDAVDGSDGETLVEGQPYAVPVWRR